MDLLENRFIIRQTLDTWEFFYKNDRVFARKISQEDFLQEVINEVYSDFFVTQDKDDLIHMLCQSTSGDIIYLKYNNSTWEKHIILISKVPELYNKHFFILPCGSTLHFFYIIKNEDRWMFIHHQMVKDKLNDPIVIDYISSGCSPFCVCKDNFENIYAFYSTHIDEKLQIIYKKYSFESLNWEPAIHISDGENDYYPKALIDKRDDIHVIWLSQDNNSHNLQYKKISKHGQYKLAISEVDSSCQNIFLINVDENLWAVWKDSSHVFTCFLDDEITLWRKPIIYDTNYFKNIYSIYYFTNILQESERINSCNILGDTENEIKLVVINDLLNLSSQYFEETAVTAENVKDSGNISLYLENIKSYFYKISEKIKYIESEKNRVLKEYAEHKRKYSLLSQENNNLKESLSMFDMEVKKLFNEVENSKKKVSNLNDLLIDRDTQIKENFKEIEELKCANLELVQELEGLKNKRGFTFIKKFLNNLFK